MGLSISSSNPEHDNDNTTDKPEPTMQMLTAPPCPDIEDESKVGEAALTKQLVGETHTLVGLKIQQLATEWMTTVAFRALFPARRLQQGGSLGSRDKRAVKNVVDALAFTHNQVSQQLQERKGQTQEQEQDDE